MVWVWGTIPLGGRGYRHGDTAPYIHTYIYIYMLVSTVLQSLRYSRGQAEIHCRQFNSETTSEDSTQDVESETCLGELWPSCCTTFVLHQSIAVLTKTHSARDKKLHMATPSLSTFACEDWRYPPAMRNPVRTVNWGLPRLQCKLHFQGTACETVSASHNCLSAADTRNSCTEQIASLHSNLTGQVFQTELDHRNVRVLQIMVSGIPLVLVLLTRMQDAYVYVVVEA